MAWGAQRVGRNARGRTGGSIYTRAPAATQVRLLVTSALCVHVGRGWRHYKKVVGHASVKRERADGERLQRLVGLRYGEVVEPYVEVEAGFWVVLLGETTLQRRHSVDDCLEVHTLWVRAMTRQPPGKGEGLKVSGEG